MYHGYSSPFSFCAPYFSGPHIIRIIEYQSITFSSGSSCRGGGGEGWYIRGYLYPNIYSDVFFLLFSLS